MVFIVNMLMDMLDHLMGMKMLVALGQVKPYPNPHRQSGNGQSQSHRLPQ